MTAGPVAFGHVCPTVSELNSDQKLIHHSGGREPLVRALIPDATFTPIPRCSHTHALWGSERRQDLRSWILSAGKRRTTSLRCAARVFMTTMPLRRKAVGSSLRVRQQSMETPKIAGEGSRAVSGAHADGSKGAVDALSGKLAS